MHSKTFVLNFFKVFFEIIWCKLSYEHSVERSDDLHLISRLTIKRVL